MKVMKKGGMAGLSAAQKEVYRRGLAAYMSSGNRPKVSQHAWAMARVKSAFGKREAAKIRAGKGKKKKKKYHLYLQKLPNKNGNYNCNYYAL